MRILVPPQFADEAETLAARKLWAILVGLFATATLLLPLIALAIPGQAGRSVRYVAVIDVGLMTLMGLSRAGRTRLASELLIFFAAVMVTLTAWQAGGVRAPGIMMYVLLVGIAGILAGPRTAIGTGVACAALSTFLLLADVRGILPVPVIRHTPFSIWLVVIFVLAEAVLVQVVVSWVVRAAAQQAAAQQAARRRIELALQDSEDRYRQLFENAQVGIYRTTPDGRILEANPALLAMLGYASLAELAQGNLNSNSYSPGYARSEFRARLEQGEVRGLEAAWHRADGRTVFVRENARAVRDLAGRVQFYEGTVEDVTERKQMEDQLRHSGKMQAIGQLAGGVAHDFNNILAGFLLNIGLTEQDPTLSAAARASLREMELQAKRAATLTRRLLLFSRRQVMETKPIDLREVLDELATMLRRIIGETYELIIDAPGVPIWIEADQGMIDQMIMNLCVNARDAMAAGGPIVVRVRVVELIEDDLAGRPDARAGRFARLQVIDTGTGMTEDTMGRLFEPFFTTKEVGKGTGLGLATVYSVAQQHAGWIEVQSTPDRGSTFSVFLPLVPEPSPQPPRSLTDPARRGSETVLVVEDESAVRRVTKHVLERLGYRVLEAESGPAAQLLWQNHKDSIAILLTDMVLPEGMSGVRLATLLKGEKPGLKIIICSGYNAELVTNRIDKEIGAVYLTKPFTVAILTATIREALDAPAAS